MPVDPTVHTTGVRDIGLRSVVSGKPVHAVRTEGEVGETPSGDRVSVTRSMTAELRTINDDIQGAQIDAERVRVGRSALEQIRSTLESLGAGPVTETKMSEVRGDIVGIVNQARFDGETAFRREDLDGLVRGQEGESPSQAFMRSLDSLESLRAHLEKSSRTTDERLARTEVARANMMAAMNLRAASGREEAASLVGQIKDVMQSEGVAGATHLKPAAVMRLV